MKASIYKIEDFLKKLVLSLDYLIYVLLNPFKFKKIPESIRKILAIDLLQIGDLIVTTPTINALRKKYPEAEIDFLLLSEMKEVLIGNKDLDMLIPYEKNLFKLIKKIRNNYDLGIILHPGSFKISLALLLAGVKYRIGSTKAGIFSGKGFFLNKKIKPNFKEQHKIEDNLDVIRPLGINQEDKNPRIYPTKEADSKVKDFLLKKDLKNFIVIHPGANYKTHMWPIENYAVLADSLIEKYKIDIVFTGSKKEKILVHNVINLMKNKAYDFSGKTIKEFFSIIKSSDFVITGDTSASHLSAALDIPVIVLFGSSNPKVWGPYTKKKRVIYKENKCTNCNKNFCFRTGNRNLECMQSITINDVLEGVKSK